MVDKLLHGSRIVFFFNESFSYPNQFCALGLGKNSKVYEAESQMMEQTIRLHMCPSSLVYHPEGDKPANAWIFRVCLALCFRNDSAFPQGTKKKKKWKPCLERYFWPFPNFSLGLFPIFYAREIRIWETKSNRFCGNNSTPETLFTRTLKILILFVWPPSLFQSFFLAYLFNASQYLCNASQPGFISHPTLVRSSLCISASHHLFFHFFLLIFLK